MTAPPLFGNLFISAGAMKAGTTWLYTVLSGHNNLLFTPEKEIHYFYAKYVDEGILKDERRLDNALSHYIGKVDPKTTAIGGLRYDLHWVVAYLEQPLDDYWYKNLFFYGPSHCYGCDFSNLYALLPAEAWRQISGNCNKLRTLYTLRHPAKRLWSHVKFHLQVINKLDLLSTWERKDFEQFARQAFIWDNAEYGRALDRLKGGLKGEQLKVLFFEDMHKAPGDTLAEIERWLEIPGHKYSDRILNQRVNESSPEPMPEFFPGLFAKDFERIVSEVESHGLAVPGAWGS